MLNLFDRESKEAVGCFQGDTETHVASVVLASPFNWRRWAEEIVGLLDDPRVICQLDQPQRYAVSVLLDKAKSELDRIQDERQAGIAVAPGEGSDPL